MILHLYVDSASFSSLPDDAISLSLRFRVDADQDQDEEGQGQGQDEAVLDATCAVTPGLASASLCQTLHVPLLDDVTRTSRVEVEAVVYSADGLRSPRGRGATTVSPVEHGAAKQVEFHDGNATTGNVKFSAFYYRFPMDINDFQQNGPTAATEQQQKFMKEYSFLQKRRLRWGDGKASSWNSTSERLLAEDPAVAANRDLAWAQGHQQPFRLNRKQQNPYGKPTNDSKQKKKLTSAQISAKYGKPKLRKTSLSVSYGGVAWPDNAGDSEEKLLQKLHIAEQKRLHLIHCAAQDARQRNRRTFEKIDNIKKSRNSVSPQEHERLKQLLRDKEQALRDLRMELESQKSTHRRATATAISQRHTTSQGRRNDCAPSGRPQVSSKRESHKKSIGCGGSGCRSRNPSYLTPTSSWAARANVAFPPTRSNNPNSNCNRSCDTVALSRARPQRRRKKRSNANVAPVEKSRHWEPVSGKFPMSVPLDVFHDGDTATTSSSSLDLDDNIRRREHASKQIIVDDDDSEGNYIDEIPASKSASALHFIQEIKGAQERLAAEEESEQVGSESNMNRIIEKYTNTSTIKQGDVLDVSITSSHR